MHLSPLHHSPKLDREKYVLDKPNQTFNTKVVRITAQEDGSQNVNFTIQNGRKPKRLKTIKPSPDVPNTDDRGQDNQALQLDEPCDPVSQSERVNGSCGDPVDQSRGPSRGSRSRVRQLMPKVSLQTSNRIASLSYLLEVFREHDIESMYGTYTVDIFQSLVISILFILTVFGLVMIILLNVLGEPSNLLGANVTLVITTGFSMLGLVLVCFRKIYKYINHMAALLVWIFMLSFIYSFVYFFPVSRHGTLDHVPMVVFTIFVIHCMLPIKMWLGLAIGVLTGVANIVVVAALAGDDQEVYLSRQLGANALLFICVNIVGAYNRYITDIAHRMFFLETRNYIEANVKYGGRKKRQKVLKEQLLNKVMPRYLVEDVKERLNQQKDDMRYLQAEQFHPLFVEGHDNVSILYADIVKFTPLAASLQPSELVFALNQLFGRFDKLAQDHNCMRIKILGDCYYCVSGLPTPTPKHATNCVKMGQHMIKVIRQIRDETGIESLDMRIGVHTGSVLCGLIGLVKWQFDIWSNSVTIANHMESSGVPGQVHVTGATLQHLGDEFNVKPGNGGERDDVIKQNRLETYLIDAPQEEDTTESPARVTPHLAMGLRSGRRMSMVEYMEQWEQCHVFQDLQNALRGAQDETEMINRRLRSFLSGEDRLQNSPDNQTIPIDYSAQELHPVLLLFRDTETEWDYLRQIDDWLPWSLMSSALCFVLIFGVQLMMMKSTVGVYVTFVLGFVAILVFGAIFLSRRHEFKKGGQGMWEGSTPIGTWRWLLRGLVTVTVLMATLTMSFVGVSECKAWNDETQALVAMATGNLSYVEKIENAGVCVHSSYFLYCLMISMIVCALFLRLTFMLKMTCMLLEMVIFCLLFFGPYHHLINDFDLFIGSEDFLHLEVRGPIYMLMLFFALVALSWRVEKDLRLSYLWRMKIAKQREQVHRQEQLNNILLENILPPHVADFFLDPDRQPDDVYHRQYTTVAVMFASIPDFFYEETNVNKNGRECIRPLNELVIAFDRLSLREDFRYVEKIKMINTTYMAAAGLTPGAERTVDENVTDLTRFAFEMMEILETYSRDILANYKLRIGLSHGEVTAGVIGAQKPQYDIWGNTVNVSSRMESHGAKGRIQVDKGTYRVLKKQGFKCERRGKVFVKGKGDMTLYFVLREEPKPRKEGRLSKGRVSFHGHDDLTRRVTEQ